MARFVHLIENLHLNNAFNGLMRTTALRTALPMGSFWAADIALMAELALLGKWALVPQRLFFRRMSAETATKLRGAGRWRLLRAARAASAHVAKLEISPAAAARRGAFGARKPAETEGRELRASSHGLGSRRAGGRCPAGRAAAGMNTSSFAQR